MRCDVRASGTKISCWERLLQRCGRRTAGSRRKPEEDGMRCDVTEEEDEEGAEREAMTVESTHRMEGMEAWMNG